MQDGGEGKSAVLNAVLIKQRCCIASAWIDGDQILDRSALNLLPISE